VTALFVAVLKCGIQRLRDLESREKKRSSTCTSSFMYTKMLASRHELCWHCVRFKFGGCGRLENILI
jgi:hypothetical protein